MTFAISPAPAPGPGAVGGLGTLLQIRLNGVDIGDRRVAVLDFVGSSNPAPAPPPGPATGIAHVSADDVTWYGGLITFSEYSIGTPNPVYTAAQYGGSAPAPDVSFGTAFLGQSCPGASPPPGVATGGWVTGTPTNPLSLDLFLSGVFIGTDTNHTASPVLSGSPFLNGAIAMLFSTDQAVVGIDGGFFNAIGSTRITAYNRDGSAIGFIANTATGMQTFILGTDTGIAQIAGLLFHFVAEEVAGFTIDRVRFGARNAAAVHALATTRGWGQNYHVVTVRRTEV